MSKKTEKTLVFGVGEDEVIIDQLVDLLFDTNNADELHVMYEDMQRVAACENSSTAIMGRMMIEKFEERFKARSN